MTAAGKAQSVAFSRRFSEFRGADWSTPPEALASGIFADMLNIDPYGSYAKVRNGSAEFKPGYNIQPFPGEILDIEVLNSSAGEFLIARIEGYNRYLYYLRTDGSQQTPQLVLNSVSGTSLYLPQSVCLVNASGGLCVFSSFGNAVVEIIGGVPTWRKMGYNSALSCATPGPPGLVGINQGAYCYGVALVRMVDGIVIRSSGVRRTFDYTGNNSVVVELGYGQQLASVTVGVSAYQYGSNTNMISDAAEGWTHIRLYRSKNLRSAVGAQNEMYLVQEIERSAFLARAYHGETWSPIVRDFDDDVVMDSMVDDSTLILADEIDLKPIPNTAFGAASHRRIWFSNGYGNLSYAGLPNSKYSEQYIPILSDVKVCSEDGTPIVCMVAIGDDIVVFKPTSTYRIVGGDASGDVLLVDTLIGVSDARSICPVPGFGVFALCTDGIFRLLDTSFSWTETIGGFNFSTPVKGIFSVGSKIRGVAHKGRVFLYDAAYVYGEGTSDVLYVLHLSPVIGWSRYIYGFTALRDIGALVAVNYRTDLLMIPSNKPPVLVDVMTAERDYFYDGDGVSDLIDARIVTPSTLTTTGYLELWSVLVHAACVERLVRLENVYSSGRAWYQSDPVLALPQSVLEGVARFQWCALSPRPIGFDIALALRFTNAGTLHSIEWGGMSNNGPTASDWDPYSVRGDA